MATATEKRLQVREKYKILIGRNNYSQNLRNYCYKPHSDGKYYSDCSSSVSYAYKEAGYGFGIMRTTDMISTGKFVDVPVIVKNGIIQNPEVLEIGDMLLFAGTDAGRKKYGYVGHVEMVGEISGKTVQLYGHGSGLAKRHEMNAYCKGRFNTKTGKTPIGNTGLLCVRRFILDDDFPDGTLYRGCKGDAVKDMQMNLLQLGFDLPEYGADADFGEETEKAVAAFQAHYGIEPNGIYSADTDAIMQMVLKGETPLRVVIVTGNSVNIRTLPNTACAVIDTVNNGDRLTYTGQTTTDGWHGVQYKGVAAWISGKYSRVETTMEPQHDDPAPEAQESTPAEKRHLVSVTGASVYVRMAPNTGSAILGTVHKNDRLTYTGPTTTDGWHGVEYNGIAAWISGKFSIMEVIE